MSVVGLACAAAVTCLLVGACGGDDAAPSAASIVQLGAPGETNRVLADDEVAALESPSFTEADVEFVHGMLAHHEQALVMTALVADRSPSADVPLFAERIDVSQRDEIDQMNRWLDARVGTSAGVDADHSAGHGMLRGMLTPEQLAALEAARGDEFDRLFLEGMIQHHEGALAMADELVAGGLGGQEAELFQLVQHILSDQAIEISRMREMLAERAG